MLACRFCYRFWSPKRGDIIVFKTPPLAALRCGAGGTFVKRLIGLPGERGRSASGYVYIDGKRLTSRTSSRTRRDDRTIAADEDPEGSLLHDGRQPAARRATRASWGTVPQENLIGKVFATYWPPNRISIQ